MRYWTKALFLVFFLPAFLSAAYNVTQLENYADTGYKIANIIQTPDRMFPGDEVSLNMLFYSTRDNGASGVRSMYKSPFLTTNTFFTFDKMQKDVAKNMQFTFTVPVGTKPGTYPMYFYASDDASPEKQFATIQLVINEPISQGLLVAKASTDVEAQSGKTVLLTIELTNTGSLDAQDVVIQLSNNSAVFTPLETDREYITRIQAGKSVKVPFSIGITGSSSPGYYPIVATMKYNIDNVAQPAIQQSLGVKVNSNPQLLVTTDQQASPDGGVSLSLTIANVGDTAVRGVYAKASGGRSSRIVGASDKFIGTLNLDDSSTMALTVLPRPNSGEESPSISVVVSYKDPVNQEHTLTQEISLNPSDATGARTTGAGAGGNQRFNRMHGDALFWGFSLVQLAGGLIALIVIAFLAFKWLKRRGKQ